MKRLSDYDRWSRKRERKKRERQTRKQRLERNFKKDILAADKILAAAGWSRWRRANVLRASFTTLYRMERSAMA